MEKLPQEIRYSECPQVVRRKKRIESFLYLIDKIQNELIAWKSHLLSWANRAVLINSILSNAAIYPVAIFKIPKSFATKLIN